MTTLFNHAIASALVLGLAGTASAQIVSGGNYDEAWVDPVDGDDGTGVIGDETAPFKTLNFAIFMLDTTGTLPDHLVHANPGVYSLATNGEVLPITIQPGIHVQGIGARECILRGDGMPNTNVIYPQPGMPECPSISGSAPPEREVLVDFSTSGPTEAEAPDTIEEMFDGFTFQGGAVQVYDFSEFNQRWRLSNCIFDMLTPGLGGGRPDFGMLEIRNAPDEGDVDLFHAEINILNNTFVMWHRSARLGGAGTQETTNAVGIGSSTCTNLSSQYFETATALLSVQNNLFYVRPDGQSLALLGVGEESTETLAGDATCAFPDGLAGEVLGSTYVARVLSGVVATPGVDLGGVIDPGMPPFFVGEFADAIGLYPAGFPAQRDWRLLPDSVLKDMGQAPINFPFVGSTLTAGNGTEYVEPLEPALSSFDFDMEGYANLRVDTVGAAVASQAIPDIGADEIGRLIDMGQGNDTNVRTAPTGIGAHYLLFRDAGFLTGTAHDMSVFGAAVSGVTDAFSVNPGLTQSPVVFSGFAMG